MFPLIENSILCLAIILAMVNMYKIDVKSRDIGNTSFCLLPQNMIWHYLTSSPKHCVRYTCTTIVLCLVSPFFLNIISAIGLWTHLYVEVHEELAGDALVPSKTGPLTWQPGLLVFYWQPPPHFSLLGVFIYFFLSNGQSTAFKTECTSAGLAGQANSYLSWR